MQQAFVQPFQGEIETSAKDEARKKMMRLLGNKKKMEQLERQAEAKQIIYDQSDQKGKLLKTLNVINCIYADSEAAKPLC